METRSLLMSMPLTRLVQTGQKATHQSGQPAVHIRSKRIWRVIGHLQPPDAPSSTEQPLIYEVAFSPLSLFFVLCSILIPARKPPVQLSSLASTPVTESHKDGQMIVLWKRRSDGVI